MNQTNHKVLTHLQEVSLHIFWRNIVRHRVNELFVLRQDWLQNLCPSVHQEWCLLFLYFFEHVQVLLSFLLHQASRRLRDLARVLLVTADITGQAAFRPPVHRILIQPSPAKTCPDLICDSIRVILYCRCEIVPISLIENAKCTLDTDSTGASECISDSRQVFAILRSDTKRIKNWSFMLRMVILLPPWDVLHTLLVKRRKSISFKPDSWWISLLVVVYFSVSSDMWIPSSSSCLPNRCLTSPHVLLWPYWRWGSRAMFKLDTSPSGTLGE